MTRCRKSAVRRPIITIVATTSARRQDRVRRWLPTGGTLPAATFETRHRTIVGLLWVHVLLLPLFALARGYSLRHGLVDAGPIAMFAVLAGAGPFHLSTRLRATLGSVGAITCSAVLTHLWG